MSLQLVSIMVLFDCLSEVLIACLVSWLFVCCLDCLSVVLIVCLMSWLFVCCLVYLLSWLLVWCLDCVSDCPDCLSDVFILALCPLLHHHKTIFPMVEYNCTEFLFVSSLFSSLVTSFPLDLLLLLLLSLELILEFNKCTHDWCDGTCVVHPLLPVSSARHKCCVAVKCPFTAHAISPGSLLYVLLC